MTFTSAGRDAPDLVGVALEKIQIEVAHLKNHPSRPANFDALTAAVARLRSDALGTPLQLAPVPKRNSGIPELAEKPKRKERESITAFRSVGSA